MWRIACKSQIFEGQEKSSRAVACQDIAVAISRTLEATQGWESAFGAAQLILASHTFPTTQYVLGGRKRCRQRGRQRWLQSPGGLQRSSREIVNWLLRVPVRCSRSLAQRRREPWLRTAIANALR